MKKDIFLRVEKNYKDNFEKLGDKRFHFASRLFLWTGDVFARKKLAELKAVYIGRNEKEYGEKIKSILEEDQESKDFLFGKERKKFFEKYPFLKRYNRLLFRVLFCETIYGLDLRPLVARYLKVEDFIKLRNQLWHDREAVTILSTVAVNYFYTLAYFLDKQRSFFDPNFFLELAEDKTLYADNGNVILQVYLLTHCIIGESAFYARGIERHNLVYEKMLIKLEKLILDNYAQVSLDNKVEFLVCVKLCEKRSFLEKQILQDIENSFDNKDCYFAEVGRRNNETTFKKSEHRNVLALMAFYFKRQKR